MISRPSQVLHHLVETRTGLEPFAIGRRPLINATALPVGEHVLPKSNNHCASGLVSSRPTPPNIRRFRAEGLKAFGMSPPFCHPDAPEVLPMAPARHWSAGRHGTAELALIWLCWPVMHLARSISDAVWSWGSVCVGGNGRRKGAFSACLQISSPPPLSCWLNWTKQSACATKPPKPAHKRPLGSPLLRYHL